MDSDTDDSDTDDSDSEPAEQHADEPRVTEYYFLGNEIEAQPVEDAMLILRYDPPAEDDDSSVDTGEWSVICCNEAIEVPQDLDLNICVFQEGGVVDTGEVFQTNLAWVLTREEINDLGNTEDIVRTLPFPYQLSGDPIHEQRQWDDDDLESLLLSFTA